jgi:hypothetical protein
VREEAYTTPTRNLWIAIGTVDADAAEGAATIRAGDDPETTTLSLLLPSIVPGSGLGENVLGGIEQYNERMREIGERLRRYRSERDSLAGDKALWRIKEILYDYHDLQPALFYARGWFPKQGEIDTHYERYRTFGVRLSEFVVHEAVAREEWFWAYDSAPLEERLYYARKMQGRKKWECLVEWTWDTWIDPPLQRMAER